MSYFNCIFFQKCFKSLFNSIKINLVLCTFVYSCVLFRSEFFLIFRRTKTIRKVINVFSAPDAFLLYFNHSYPKFLLPFNLISDISYSMLTEFIQVHNKTPSFTVTSKIIINYTRKRFRCRCDSCRSRISY